MKFNFNLKGLKVLLKEIIFKIKLNFKEFNIYYIFLFINNYLNIYYCLYYLNSTRNSRVSGHGIRIVLYALVRLVTVVVLLK
jgi:hypothetical protein